jgi:hypothetical protein
MLTSFLQLENLSVNGKMKVNLKEIIWEGLGLIGLGQERDKCRAFVKAVVNV